ncbi:MAG: Crp/Fnr family transcriptional regulator [Beijerinckiaceae bacterium]
MQQIVQAQRARNSIELSAIRAIDESQARSNGHRKLSADEALWCEGDARTHICSVLSGAICFSRVLLDGRRIVLGFAYPGDIIGLGGDFAPSDAHAVQTTRLELIPASVFKRAAKENPDLGRKAAVAVANQLDEAYQHVVVISKLSACERLASFLVALSHRNERRGLSRLSVILPMKRIDIADYLGLTIETISRTFTQFRVKGLIELQGTNIVLFKKLDVLQAMAAGGQGE